MDRRCDISVRLRLLRLSDRSGLDVVSPTRKIQHLTNVTTQLGRATAGELLSNARSLAGAPAFDWALTAAAGQLSTEVPQTLMLLTAPSATHLRRSCLQTPSSWTRGKTSDSQAAALFRALALQGRWQCRERPQLHQACLLSRRTAVNFWCSVARPELKLVCLQLWSAQRVPILCGVKARTEQLQPFIRAVWHRTG